MNEQYNTTDYPKPHQIKCEGGSPIFTSEQGFPYTCSPKIINLELNDRYVCQGESVKQAFEYCKEMIWKVEPEMLIISPN